MSRCTLAVYFLSATQFCSLETAHTLVDIILIFFKAIHRLSAATFVPAHTKIFLCFDIAVLIMYAEVVVLDQLIVFLQSFQASQVLSWVQLLDKVVLNLSCSLVWLASDNLADNFVCITAVSNCFLHSLEWNCVFSNYQVY
ncbi:Hypothetical_protein [Hexamita inflata]|uniref:Hypothetical_protein n=1 Tax=Hexamita inflata TaxID=28002 RepID=A0ABP1KS38_9EUKA